MYPCFWLLFKMCANVRTKLAENAHTISDLKQSENACVSNAKQLLNKFKSLSIKNKEENELHLVQIQLLINKLNASEIEEKAYESLKCDFEKLKEKIKVKNDENTDLQHIIQKSKKDINAFENSNISNIRKIESLEKEKKLAENQISSLMIVIRDLRQQKKAR